MKKIGGSRPQRPACSGQEGGDLLPTCSCVAPTATCLEDVGYRRAKNMQDPKRVWTDALASACPGRPVGDVGRTCAHTDTTELAQTTPASRDLVTLPLCRIHDSGLTGSVQKHCTPMQQT